MKFHLSTATGNVITGFGEGWVRIGTQEFRENVVITPSTIEVDWAPRGFDELDEGSFRALLVSSPEVAILGTGRTMRFPHPRLTRPLTEAQVGLEVMDTAAACRTYNILAGEGRKVVAALIIE
jgi:uncharacterized protein